MGRKPGSIGLATSFTTRLRPGSWLCLRDLMRRNTKVRIDPLNKATPDLRDPVSAPRSRDGGNSLFRKPLSGGQRVTGGAESAAMKPSAAMLKPATTASSGFMKPEAPAMPQNSRARNRKNRGCGIALIRSTGRPAGVIARPVGGWSACAVPFLV